MYVSRGQTTRINQTLNEVAERIKQAFTKLGFDDYWVDCYYDQSH